MGRAAANRQGNTFTGLVSLHVSSSKAILSRAETEQSVRSSFTGTAGGGGLVSHAPPHTQTRAHAEREREIEHSQSALTSAAAANENSQRFQQGAT